MLNASGDVQLWCSFCNSEPATDEMPVSIEGIQDVYPIGPNCLKRAGIE